MYTYFKKIKINSLNNYYLYPQNMKTKNIFLILIIFSLLYIQIFSSSGIAIDFGSEFITTSIIRSRKPIELVENPQGTKANQYL